MNNLLPVPPGDLPLEEDLNDLYEWAVWLGRTVPPAAWVPEAAAAADAQSFGGVL